MRMDQFENCQEATSSDGQMAESSSSSMGSSPSAFTDLLEDGKNKTKIFCQICRSLVLSPNNAKMVEKEVEQLRWQTEDVDPTNKKFFLPHMFKKNEAQPMDGEDLRAFWLVEDMFTFDNVGFTNTVDSIKYLICADCEIGPIGWHNISDKKAFYVAVERVKHE